MAEDATAVVEPDASQAAATAAAAEAEEKAGDVIQAEIDKITAPAAPTEAATPPADGSDDPVARETREDGEGEAAGEKPTPEPKAVPVELNDRQKRAAEVLGLDDDDIAALGESAVAVIEKGAAAISRKMSEAGRAEQARAAEAAKAEGGDGEGGPDAADAAFTDDDWYTDEGVAKITRLSERMGELQALSERVDTIESGIKADNDAKTQATVDAFFAGLLDKDGKATDYPQFGLGRAKAGSDEDSARTKVVEQALAIQAGNLSALGEHVPLEQALDNALAIVAAEQMRAAASRKTSKKYRERSRQRTGRPSGRTGGGEAPSGEDQAGAAMDKVARERGIELKP